MRLANSKSAFFSSTVIYLSIVRMPLLDGVLYFYKEIKLFIKKNCDFLFVSIVFIKKGILDLILSYQVQEKSFRQKYALYSRMLFKLSMVYLGSKFDAEDILQNVFIKLLYHAPKFQNGEHEKGWLIRVCINECKNKLASEKRRQHITLDENFPDSRILPEEDVKEAVFRLPEKYKEVIHLYYYEGYDINAISEILQINISTVKMRLVRSREALKIDLEEK